MAMHRPVATDVPRQRLLLDRGWRFKLGHASDPARDFGFGIGHAYSKAGNGPAGASLRFPDYAWRVLDLPHDWGVELPFDETADRWHGYRPLGRRFPVTSIGWYRRRLEIRQEDLGRRLSVEFDGVFRDCIVWFNGHVVARNESGYIGFAFDITDIANYGGRNVLAVRVDASQHEGWSYEGAGIYRHVWLTRTDSLHVARHGTQIITDVRDDGSASITLRTSVINESDDSATFTVATELVDASGSSAASIVSGDLTLAGWTGQEVEQHVAIGSPSLWSPESPYLYRAVSRLRKGDVVTDVYETTCGIRTTRFDPDEGFFLNGRHVVLKGTCNHQDHAGVGSALPDRLNYWRTERLKELGCNAIRTSHHPPTPERLDACDRLRMLVMDEHRMMGSSPEVLGQLERLVLRDRNHPSVVIWCIGNEEPIQGTDTGSRVASTMQRLVHKLDPTRLCTMAMNRSWGLGLSSVIDVQGFNYKQGGSRIARYRQDRPTQPSIGTEEASTLCTRGEYADDREQPFVTAYDMRSPSWGATAESSWTFYSARPWLAGVFIWTGFDYRGEPTPYRWPAASSQFGIMDTCGFSKDNFYYYQAWWSDTPVLHILPHWNWPGEEGREIDVRCFSNAEEVELLLNGTSLGRQVMPANSHVAWNVKYEPGTLLARGYRGGNVVMEKRVETTGPAAGIQLLPDRAAIDADNEDVAIVTVAVVDAQGRTVPVAGDEIRFGLLGQGRILGVGNGNPGSHEPDTFVPSLLSAPLADWRMLVLEDAHPEDLDGRSEVARQCDDASWRRVDLSSRGDGSVTRARTIVYRGSVELPAEHAGEPAGLHIGGIRERGWIYVNGRLAARTDRFERSGYHFENVQAMLLPGLNTVAVVARGADVSEHGGGARLRRGGTLLIHPAPQWKRRVFNGLAQVIVQAGTEPHPIKLTARGDGLEPCDLEIRLRVPTVARALVP